MSALRHVGLGFGRVEHWHDGLGEFSRQLGLALAREAPRLRAEHGVVLHYHLPQRWHGEFGDEVRYLATHTLQRWCHLRGQRFSLWHTLHQHNRLKAPLGCRRVIETVHDLNFLHTKRGARLQRYHRRLRHRLSRCDLVVTDTHYVAGDLRREFGTVPAPIEVVHIGVANLTQAPQRALPDFDPAPFLLHVSRMAPTKNIDALLGLAAHWPEQRFVLAGATSPYTADVQRMLRERGLRNVEVRLDIDEAEKAWLYAHCEGFLFPSLAEGFGLPPLEAMHFGKPVFLSRLTSLPEVGGEAAFYFDSFEPAAMRETVTHGLRLAAHGERVEAIVRQARQFSWSRCTQQYLALYLQWLDR